MVPSEFTMEASAHIKCVYFNIIYFSVLGTKFLYNPVTDIKYTPGHETCHQGKIHTYGTIKAMRATPK